MAYLSRAAAHLRKNTLKNHAVERAGFDSACDQSRFGTCGWRSLDENNQTPQIVPNAAYSDAAKRSISTDKCSVCRERNAAPSGCGHARAGELRLISYPRLK
jgi:hypothetical protein